MNERQPDGWSSGERTINSNSYQAAALELLYACLAKTSGSASIEQPTSEEVSRGILLEPPDDFNEEYGDEAAEPEEGWGDWEMIDVSVYTDGHKDEADEEVMAAVSFNQFFIDGLEGTPDLELIKSYKLRFTGKKYLVECQYFFYDYSIDDPDMALSPTETKTVASEYEVSALAELVNSSSE